MSSSEITRRSPYQGLIPYSEKDAPFFFGREKETRLITANLFASPLTLLYGASGVGKSSVLRAGVSRQLQGREDLLVVVFNSWQSNPVVDLVQAIADRAKQVDPTGWDKVMSQMPRDGEITLGEFLPICAAGLDRRLMIILDQFEEYFLYHPLEDEFASEFAKAVTKPEAPVSFLISIREDFYAKLDRFEGRIPTLYDNYLRIEHLDRKAARIAIEKPIAEYNRVYATDGQFSIEPELVAAVLRQVETGQVVIGETGRGVIETSKSHDDADAQIETPFLQLVMTRLWETELKDNSHDLRLKTLEGLGGAENIVRTHLDAVISKLTANDQEIAAGIFHYLVTPSGTKIAYTASDLALSADLSEAEVLRVLEKLSHGDVRILRPVDPTLDKPGAPRYEIFHDVLAPAILSWRTAYVQARERADAEQREEEQRRRADEQAKVASRFRRLAVALAVVILLALGAAVLAVTQTAKANNYAKESDRLREEGRKDKQLATMERENAEEAKAVANEASKNATMARLETEEQIKVAEQRKAEAEKAQAVAVVKTEVAAKAIDTANAAKMDAEVQARAARVGFARALSAQSNGFIDVAPQRSLLLAIEALRATNKSDPRVPAAETALHHALSEIGGTTIGENVPDNETKGPVTNVVFSQGNHWLASASGSSVKLWDLTKKKSTDPPLVLNDVGGPIYFSADNRWLVTGQAAWPSPKRQKDITAYLWDLSATESNAQPVALRGSSDGILQSLITPDSRWLIIYNDGFTANLWDLKSKELNKITLTLSKADNRISSLEMAVSPDSRWLITSPTWIYSATGDSKLWDLTSANPATNPIVLNGTYAASNHVAFSSDSKWLVTATDMCSESEKGLNNYARLWNLKSGNISANPVVLRGQEGPIGAVAFSPDNLKLATGSGTAYTCPVDNAVHLWDLTANDIAANSVAFRGHDGPVFAILFSRGLSDLLITASTNELGGITRGHPKVDGAFNPTGPLQGNTTIRAWMLGEGREGTPPLIIGNSRGSNGPVALSPDGRWLVSLSYKKIFAWDLLDLQRILYGYSEDALSGHEENIETMAFSSDSHWLITGSRDGSTRQWDLSTRQFDALPIRLPNNGYQGLFLSSADKRLIVSTGTKTSALPNIGGTESDAITNNEIRVWDLTTPEPRFPLIMQGHKGKILSASVSQDNRWLVTGSEDGEVRRWDLKSMVPADSSRILASSIKPVLLVAFSPDNRWIISGHADGTVRLWDLKSDDPNRNPIVLQTDHKYQGYSAGDELRVEISPDNRWLIIAGSSSINATLWDMSTISSTSKPIADLGKIYSRRIAFSPDGHWLVTYPLFTERTDSSYTARLWNLSAKSPADATFTLQGHARQIDNVIFTPNNRWLVTTSAGDEILRWDLNAADPSAFPYTLNQKRKDDPNRQINNFVLSPDGRWLVADAAVTPDIAVFWDLNAPDPAASVKSIGPPRPGGQLQFTFDLTSRWLVIHGVEGNSLMLDMTAQDPNVTRVVLPIGGQLTPTLSFSYDDRWFISRSPLETIDLWKMKKDELVDSACRAAGRNLSESEWKEYFPDKPYQKTCPDLPAGTK